MAKVTKSGAAITKSTEISLEELAAITGRSKTWLNERAAEGFFKSERHGVYRLGNAMSGIIRFYERQRKETSQTASSAEVQKARAEGLRLVNAQRAGKLMYTSTHFEVVDIIVGDTKSELNGMAGRLTRDRDLRAEYEKIFHDMAQRLTDKWNKRAKGEIPKDDGTAEDD
jgi:hypothetical protein